jgi:hypothetical protein
MSEHKQLLQAIAPNPEVDQSSVAVDTEPGGAFTLEQHRRVSFKADPLVEVRAIKQTDAPAELGAERLEQVRTAWARRVQCVAKRGAESFMESAHYVVSATTDSRSNAFTSHRCEVSDLLRCV